MALRIMLTIGLCVSLAQGADAEKVTLKFANADIDAVVRAIAHMTGRTFVVDPRVKGSISLVSEKPMTKAQALNALTSTLRLYGYSVIETGNVTRVVPEVDAKVQGGQVNRGMPPERGDELITQVFQLNYESANALVPVLRPLIASNNPINAYPANNTIVITDYSENLRRIAKIIAAIDTPAGSEIEVIPVRYAVATDLALIASRLVDAGQTPDPGQKVTVLAEPGTNSLLVRAANPARVALMRSLIAKLDIPSAAGSDDIHVVHLRNAEAAALAKTLSSLGSGASVAPSSVPTPTSTTAPPVRLTGSVTAVIQADTATNTLIITASPEHYRKLRAVIDKLDIRRAQVFVEALIVEVTSDQAAEFGVQWLAGLDKGNASGTNVLGGTNFGDASQNIVSGARNIGNLGPGLNIGVIKGTVSLPGIGSITNLAFLARALESRSQANILSTPNIMTLDNEEAKIVVGQNVPFVTGQFTNQGSATTVNPFQTVERKDVGLTLKVKPQVSEGGVVRLTLYQEISSIQDLTLNAGVITNKRSIETSVLVDDGSIVVLGGLVEDSVSESVGKVPLLGDIPFLGRLFRYDSRKRGKKNLMLFLRPYVVRDESTASVLAVDRYDMMRDQQKVTQPEKHPILPAMAAPALPSQIDKSQRQKRTLNSPTR